MALCVRIIITSRHVVRGVFLRSGRHVCSVTQQTCLLCHTDMSAASHSRQAGCVTQQTCRLCHTAGMSVVSHSRHICCVARGMECQSSFHNCSAMESVVSRNKKLPYMYMYIYIYVYICICVHVQTYLSGRGQTLTTPVDPAPFLRRSPKSTKRYVSEAVR